MERLVHGGEGIVRISGKVGFVSGVIPGESVRIEITEDKPRRFRARLLEIPEPSPHRVTPRCSVFSICGGCDWQYISYDHQLEIKRGILVEDLSRLGGMNVKAEDVRLERSDPWEYRGRVQVHGDPDGRPGFKARRSDEIVPVEYCPVARPSINSVLASQRSVAPGSRVSVAEGVQGVHASRTVAGFRLDFDPAGFFQANVPLLDRLVTRVGESVRTHPPGTIVDLYAGAGVLAVAAAAALQSNGTPHPATEEILPRRIICVELDRRNSAYILDNIMRTGVPATVISVIPKRVEKAIRELMLGDRQERRSTTLIVDPPRGGLAEAVRTWITANRLGRLLYLSCDSASLARDLTALTEAYRIEDIRLFDFFPQTAHIETLVELALRSDE